MYHYYYCYYELLLLQIAPEICHLADHACDITLMTIAGLLIIIIIIIIHINTNNNMTSNNMNNDYFFIFRSHSEY